MLAGTGSQVSRLAYVKTVVPGNQLQDEEEEEEEEDVGMHNGASKDLAGAGNDVQVGFFFLNNYFDFIIPASFFYFHFIFLFSFLFFSLFFHLDFFLIHLILIIYLFYF